MKQMLLSGLTIAFATIPEERPILVTVLVAVGGVRLARRNVLLRRLRAAEAIGAVTVVLTDKTGTPTENRLLLDTVEGDGRACSRSLAQPLCFRLARPDRHRVRSSRRRITWAQPRGDTRFPFDPERKRASAVWSADDGPHVFVKGAHEHVLVRSSWLAFATKLRSCAAASARRLSNGVSFSSQCARLASRR